MFPEWRLNNSVSEAKTQGKQYSSEPQVGILSDGWRNPLNPTDMPSLVEAEAQDSSG